jgi:hypothetical protein
VSLLPCRYYCAPAPREECNGEVHHTLSKFCRDTSKSASGLHQSRGKTSRPDASWVCSLDQSQFIYVHKAQRDGETEGGKSPIFANETDRLGHRGIAMWAHLKRQRGYCFAFLRLVNSDGPALCGTHRPRRAAGNRKGMHAAKLGKGVQGTDLHQCASRPPISLGNDTCKPAWRPH